MVAFDSLYSLWHHFRLPREPERQDRCRCILVFCIKGPAVVLALQVLQPSCTLVCAITVAHYYNNHYNSPLYVVQNNLIVIKEN